MSMMVSPYRFASSTSWTPATLPDLVQYSPSWHGYTLRQRIENTLIPANGSLLRFSLRGGAVTEGLTIAKAYIGNKGTGAFDFASAPTQVFWGGNPGFSVAVSGAAQMCDPITFSVTTSSNLMISVYVFGDTLNDAFTRYNGTPAGWGAGYKNADDVTTLVASGYTTQNMLYLDDLEVAS